MNENHFENLKAKIESSVKNTITELSNTNLKQLENKVVENIQGGISPVEGAGRFVNYSDSYRNAISKNRYSKFNKKLRPVNLTLSGDMLKSIYTQKTSEGFLIGFKDELAHIHTVEGAGKSKTIRKLLPQGSEYFSNAITSFLRKTVSDSWVSAFNKAKDKL